MFKVKSELARREGGSCLPSKVVYGDVSESIATLAGRSPRSAKYGANLGAMFSALFIPSSISLGRMIVQDFLGRELHNGKKELTINLCDDSDAADPCSENLVFTYQGVVFSPRLSRVLISIAPVTWFNVPLLLTGEYGVGKWTLARSIHISSQATGDIVRVDCTWTSTSSLIEIVERMKEATASKDTNVFATLYLEHIEELGDQAQSYVTSILKQREFEQRDNIWKIRIIASSENDLTELVREGKIRRDLSQELGVINIIMPSLRQQSEAVVPTFIWFMDSISLTDRTIPSDLKNLRIQNDIQYSSDYEMALISHSWPGNFRELRKCADNGYMASLLSGQAISSDLIVQYFKTIGTMDSSRFGTQTEGDSSEKLVKLKTSEVLISLKQDEKRYGESLSAYFRRIGLRNPHRIDVGRRVVLAYAKFLPNIQLVARRLGFVEGEPQDATERDQTRLNMNNFTTYLSELGLKQSTLSEPISIGELKREEQVWLKRLRRKQVLN